MKKVGIIGAGLGGLTSSIYLAKNNYSVKVFEKNSNPGGKLSEFRMGGYRFDIGPSLLTMPFIIEDLSSDCGLDVSQLDISKIDPICKYFYSDQSIINSWHDVSRLEQEIEKVSKSDADNLEKFFNYSKSLYDLTSDIFLFTPFQEISKILKWKNLNSLFRLHKIDAFRSMDAAIRSYFTNSKIIQLFGRYATYNGSSPYMAPATLNIIPYVEFILGSYYIKGGMYKLAEYLYVEAQKLGVEFEFDTQVTAIENNNKKISGIHTEATYENFDYIIANSDVAHTYEKLINNFPKARTRISKLEPSLSGFIMLLGINKIHKNLEHHNIFFAKDYQKEFDDIVNKKITTDDPTIYLAISSKTDQSDSPFGKENWFILVNTPYLNSNIDWNNQKTRMRNLILKKLLNYGFDIESNIEFEKIITPLDLYDKYLSNKGSIYGTSSNSMLSAFLRQRNRSSELKGLFFASGSAHPGGGIPLAILSGKHAANLIMESKYAEN